MTSTAAPSAAPVRARVARASRIFVEGRHDAELVEKVWGDDLRPLLPRITAPTLVLGAWAAFEPMGSTMESTRKIFEGQYAGLAGVKIAMSERGYHFLMWDDTDWLVAQVRGFIERPVR